MADDLVSVVTSHLLVPDVGARARLLSYSGRGPLSAWVKMVCRRKAIELHRATAPVRNDAAEILKNTAPVIDPELDYLKFRYAREFNRALEETLRVLPAEDANLLYLTVVKRVGLGATARMLGVSVRTVQRRLSATQAQVFAETRTRVREQLSASEEEISSLLALVQSQLGVTLHRVLQPDQEMVKLEVSSEDGT